MKNIKTLIAVIPFLFISNYALCQSFTYRIWSLNETVTFNDIVNFVEDKSKIITEPSVYIKGEDIKFYEDNNRVITFSFKKNTQVLNKITFDVTNLESIEYLKKSIFHQLGNPSWGYEKKLFFNIKKDIIMPDFTAYDILYIYKTDKNIIWISFSFGNLQIMNKLTKEYFYGTYGNAIDLVRLYGDIYEISGMQYMFKAYTEKLYDLNSTLPKDYIKSYDNGDYWWGEKSCEIIKKW